MADHGTRTRYVVGCRCEPCRAAHRDYNRDWDRRHRRIQYGIEDRTEPYVDASEAIAHLHWLRSQGVGKRTIAKAAGVGLTSIDELTQGIRTRSRPDTIQRILAVGTHKIADGSTIDARPAWALINDLLELGVTKARIAQAIGAQTPALQINRHRIKPDTMRRIRQAWTAISQELDPWHGTYTGYAKHACRCIRCRKAMRDYTAERRAAT